MREAIENLLKSAGYRAEGYASAEDYLRAARFAAISCMVLDMQLPGMSGLELLRTMGELGLRTPVVFVSATDGHRREQALSAGALAFFMKPVHDADLLEAVRRAVASDHS
jgi:FixJ family two-component response regulator